MTNAVSVNSNTLSEILTTLKRLEREMLVVKNQLSQAPPYGSDEWWEWSDKKAMNEIKHGDYFELKNKKELDKFLDNIKTNRSNEKYHHRIQSES